jgi:hypothetical protein
MGHVRHSAKKIVASKDAYARPVAGLAKLAPRRTADLVDLKPVRVESPEMDVWRQARQLRAEWRRERYARLRGG